MIGRESDLIAFAQTIWLLCHSDTCDLSSAAAAASSSAVVSASSEQLAAALVNVERVTLALKRCARARSLCHTRAHKHAPNLSRSLVSVQIRLKLAGANLIDPNPSGFVEVALQKCSLEANILTGCDRLANSTPHSTFPPLDSFMTTLCDKTHSSIYTPI